MKPLRGGETEIKSPIPGLFCVIVNSNKENKTANDVTTGANVRLLTHHRHLYPSLRAVTLILCLLLEHHNVYTVHYIPCRLGLRLDIRLFVNAVALMTDWLNGAVREHRPHVPYHSAASDVSSPTTTHTACWRHDLILKERPK